MFDIGFFEIFVISVIALFVIGPEKLPETIKTFSLWFGRFKRGLRETRRELEQQIGADDIRRELHNEEVMRNLSNLHKEVNQTLNEQVKVDDEDEASYYPPGHMDHDPNNDIDDLANDPQFLADNGLSNTDQNSAKEAEQDQDTSASDTSDAETPGEPDTNDKSAAS